MAKTKKSPDRASGPTPFHGNDVMEALGDARRWLLVQTHYGIDVYEVRALRGSAQSPFDLVASVACDAAAWDVIEARRARFAAPVQA